MHHSRRSDLSLRFAHPAEANITCPVTASLYSRRLYRLGCGGVSAVPEGVPLPLVGAHFPIWLGVGLVSTPRGVCVSFALRVVRVCA